MENTPAKTGRKSFSSRLQHMVDRLRTDILNGVYSPGDYLPSEMALAEQFHLSNKSVRKGLEQLVGESLIVKIDRVGSRVSDLYPQSTVGLTLGYSASIERDFGLSLLLDDFRSLYPSIRIKALPLRSVTDYVSTVQQYADNGIVDIFTLNSMDFQTIVESGRSRALEPFEPDAQTYRFAQEAFEFEGTLLAKPIIFSPIVLAYNRTHFQEAGVPEPDSSWTWNDILHHASALTESGKRHALYFYLLSDNRWPAFLLQSGMRFEPGPDSPFRLEGSRLLESIRLCKQLIDNRGIFPSYLSENSDDVHELFKQGKVSMVLTNYMTINDFKHTSLNYDISPMPFMYEPRSLLHVIGVAVNPNSAQKKAAHLLAGYLSSPRAQQIIRDRTLSLPALKPVAEAPLSQSEEINRPSRYALFREIMFSYRLHRELNLSTASFHALKRLLKAYWSDLIDEPVLCEQVADLLREGGFGGNPERQ